MSFDHLELLVSEEFVGLRLDKYLSLQNQIRTRNRAEHLIEKGLVTLNGLAPKGSYHIKLNDRIIVSLPAIREKVLTAVDIPLDIIY
jgi:23S rRNA pseudouridine1911/1915/1917 synthase